ncbi:MAG: LPP20 family lipoprotein [Sulfurimonas sp.]
MKILFAFLVGITAFFSGCGSSQEPQPLVQQQKLPQWYTSPPLSNSTTLYALGEGRDKKEAVATALSYMASTLSVSIESSYRAKTRVREGSVTSHEGVYDSDIASDVKKIRISNYQVLQAKSLGFKRYAVLISSNKQTLFSSLKKELEQKITLTHSKEKNLKNDPLAHYLFYKKLQNDLSNIPNTLIVMGELHNGFRDQKYINFLEEIEKKYNYYHANISFSISSNISNLGTPIAKALSKKGFALKKKNSKMHYRVIVDTSVERANAYGFTLARAELHIKTKSANGVTVASNVLHLQGQSSQGYSVAKQDLIRQLSNTIEKDGIAKVLNLNI